MDKLLYCLDCTHENPIWRNLLIKWLRESRGKVVKGKFRILNGWNKVTKSQGAHAPSVFMINLWAHIKCNTNGDTLRKAILWDCRTKGKVYIYNLLPPIFFLVQIIHRHAHPRASRTTPVLKPGIRPPKHGITFLTFLVSLCTGKLIIGYKTKP